MIRLAIVTIIAFVLGYAVAIKPTTPAVEITSPELTAIQAELAAKISATEQQLEILYQQQAVSGGNQDPLYQRVLEQTLTETEALWNLAVARAEALADTAAISSSPVAE